MVLGSTSAGLYGILTNDPDDEAITQNSCRRKRYAPLLVILVFARSDLDQETQTAIRELHSYLLSTTRAPPPSTTPTRFFGRHITAASSISIGRQRFPTGIWCAWSATAFLTVIRVFSWPQLSLSWRNDERGIVIHLHLPPSIYSIENQSRVMTERFPTSWEGRVSA
jgi:hypothetical protein